MDNKMFVEKIYLGKKIHNKTAMHLPFKLALAIMRDKDGNINLVVPVEGDLNNPKFNVWKIVGQVLKNLLLKAVAAPANLFASAFGGKEEDFKEIPFDFAQHELTEKQMEKLSTIKKILDEKPELVLEMKQVIDTAKAIEYLAFFEARKAYFFRHIKHQPIPDSLPAEDLKAIDNIDNSEPSFLSFVDSTLNLYDPLISPLEKCIRLTGHDKLVALQLARMERRNNILRNYLITTLNIPETRFKITTTTDCRIGCEHHKKRTIVWLCQVMEHAGGRTRPANRRASGPAPHPQADGPSGSIYLGNLSNHYPLAS